MNQFVEHERMMRSRCDDPSLRTSNQRVARRTVWSDALVRALADMRARHPNASLELSALEFALADVTRNVEMQLDVAANGTQSATSQSAETMSG
jgi:hypothetical protein